MPLRVKRYGTSTDTSKTGQYLNGTVIDTLEQIFLAIYLSGVMLELLNNKQCHILANDVFSLRYPSN